MKTIFLVPLYKKSSGSRLGRMLVFGFVIPITSGIVSNKIEQNTFKIIAFVIICKFVRCLLDVDKLSRILIKLFVIGSF